MRDGSLGAGRIGEVLHDKAEPITDMQACLRHGRSLLMKARQRKKRAPGAIRGRWFVRRFADTLLTMSRQDACRLSAYTDGTTILRTRTRAALGREGLEGMAQPFRVGDRVQITRPHAGLACGSRGTIRQAFPAGEFYDVRFDTKVLPRLVHWSDLEAAAPVLQARALGDG